jgi:hypothetical protein
MYQRTSNNPQKSQEFLMGRFCPKLNDLGTINTAAAAPFPDLPMNQNNRAGCLLGVHF